MTVINVKQMNRKFVKLDTKVKEHRNENKQLKQQSVNLSKQVNELTTTVICFENRINEFQKKNEHLEAQSYTRLLCSETEVYRGIHHFSYFCSKT